MSTSKHEQTHTELHSASSLFMHIPSQWHKEVHLCPPRWHLQFPLQATLHPQLIRAAHPLLTSGRSLQCGIQILKRSFHWHPYSLGERNTGCLMKDLLIASVPRIDLLKCWNAACLVGGIASIGLRCLRNITFLASFKDWHVDLGSYWRIMNLSRTFMWSDSRVIIEWTKKRPPPTDWRKKWRRAKNF